MIWTVILNDDSSIRSVKPGRKLGRRCKHQFQVEASDYERAQVLALEGAAGKVFTKPAATYRHPAFQQYSSSSPLPRCPCGAYLGPGERECAVCRNEDNKNVQAGRALDLTPQRKMVRNEAHLRILLEVKEQWIRAHNVGSFSRWLNQQIELVEKSQCIPVSTVLDPAPV